MTRVEEALAECDWRIALWETAPGSLMPPLLRIGRDVLTRHAPAAHKPLSGDWCPLCSPDALCVDVRPWLDLFAPEQTP